MSNVVSKFFLESLKLEILTDPVKDKEHAWAVIVVRKNSDLFSQIYMNNIQEQICSRS